MCLESKVDGQGFYPHILQLTWPLGVKPLDLPDFETQARRLRYRALGAGCRDKQLRYLLLGHHEDDQAETVLMRLASGHKGTGLRGMLPYSAIPECWGMHGVHESGQYDFAARRLERLVKRQMDRDEIEYTQHLKRLIASKPIFEKGGVDLVRPLLHFSKQRLVETCRAHDVTWEEDKTNQDAWRTPRNTIRELLSSSVLPRVLRKASMLGVARRRLQESLRNRATAERIFTHCEILLFDARSGGLVVRFPQQIAAKTAGHSRATQIYKLNARFSAAVMLRRFVETVMPYEEIPVRNLRFAVQSMFPGLRDEDDNVDPRLQPNGFTVGGVQFQRLESPLPEPHSEIRQDAVRKGTFDWANLDPAFVWKLTRQPFSKALPTFTVPPSVKAIPSLPVSGISPPDVHITSQTSAWSSWELWDGRYWVRILNHSLRALVVRPFQPADLQRIKAKLPSRQWRTFHDYLRQAAPDQLRWTLLAIAEVGDEKGAGQVLVLPTLGQAGELAVEDEKGVKRLEWEVRYKKIRLGHKVVDDRRVSRNRNVITTWND